MNKNKTNLSVVNAAGIRINSNIIVGDQGSFSSGDILDANAVEKMVNDSTGNMSSNVQDQIDTLQNSVQNIQNLIDADEASIDTAIDKWEEIVDFLNGIEPGSELYTIIHSHIDNGVTGVIKHVEVLTQAQYDALTTKDPNTEYNIIAGS